MTTPLESDLCKSGTIVLGSLFARIHDMVFISRLSQAEVLELWAGSVLIKPKTTYAGLQKVSEVQRIWLLRFWYDLVITWCRFWTEH